MKTNFVPKLLDLQLSNGNTKRWRFRPQTILIDDVTDYIVGIYLEFDNGDVCNLLLAPSDYTRYQLTEFFGDVLAEVGAEIAGSQIRLGNQLVDNLVAHTVGEFAKTSVKNMFRHVLQAQCSYFAVDNNELVVKRALTAFDLMDV